MKNWFRFKVVKDISDRAFGAMARLLGLDVSLVIMGWVSDWTIIDIRLPVNWGIYLQILFIVVSIGRLPNEVYEAS